MQLLINQTTNITTPVVRHFGGKITFQLSGVPGGATVNLYQSLDNISWVLTHAFTTVEAFTIPYLNSMYFRASVTGATGSTNVTLMGG